MKLKPLIPNGNIDEHIEQYKKYYNLYFGKHTNCIEKTIIFADVVYSYFRFGAWINNYFRYQFWKKSSRERDKFLTWRRARDFINDVNNVQETRYNPLFRQKHKFLEEYAQYIHRDWLYVTEATYDELVAFLQKHKAFMQKNDQGTCGVGICKVKSEEITDFEKYYEYAKENDLILEEYIEECEAIRMLHSSSLNTIRVMTLCDSNSNKVAIIGASLRMGNNGSVVDNANATGIFAKIDIETGVIKTKAVDFEGNAYINHPYSGQQVLGVQIPEWDNVKLSCMKAALKHKEVPLVGWDIVVREKAGKMYVELIEGNSRPGVETLQMPDQKGLYHKIRRCMKSWRK